MDGATPSDACTGQESSDPRCYQFLSRSGLLALNPCRSLLFFLMLRVGSRHGHPTRGMHSCAAAQVASARLTQPLPTVRSCSTRRSTWSGDALPSVVQVSVVEAEASSATGSGSSRKVLLGLIRVEF